MCFVRLDVETHCEEEEEMSKIRWDESHTPIYKQFRGSSCYICGKKELLEVHHLDWDHFNDTLTNLVTLCRRCHIAVHKVGYLSQTDLYKIKYRIDLSDFDNAELTILCKAGILEPEYL